ncbi:MAG: acyl-CoA dehydrogenase [Gammaproteobacteria bacterium]|nr:MAG: acyl-CoA dehydrogenase [Gammaproteobacteria bacterium]
MELAHIISVIVIVGLVFTSAFFQLATLVWTALIGIALISFTLLGYLTAPWLIIFWLGYLCAALFANLHQLRRRYLILPALKILQQRMPPISNTEREAIDAGHTWWEKELFCGQPQWKKLFAIPKPTLTAAEQSFVDNQVETLCGMLCDWEITQKNRDLSPEVWEYLKKEKFFGMVIAKEYGGLGFSALAHSTVVVKIATRSISAAVNTMVPNSLGPGELLSHYGTEEQKNYYLPRLAAGQEIPCFALTAPDAGSDAGSIPDTGIICQGEYNGKEVIGIRLNWDKRYITLAPIATVLGLAIQLYDPEHLVGEEEEIGITLCLIPTTHPGVEIGNRHYPLQLAFMNGPTRGKDVFIPLDWIIGGPKMAGQGWRMLMECLSIGRSISLPALATACSKMTYRYTGAYARLRRQFNTPIASFEGIEEALGYIAGGTYMVEATRMMTAGAVDLHIKPAIASAIAKYHLTEISRSVVAHAMDIHAGHMIQLGPRNFLANVHFATPISITVEGANILTRNLIIFGQGAIRCHPYLLKEVELITSPHTKIEDLDRVLMSHVGFFISNLLRNLAYGLTGGRFIFASVRNRRIKKYQRQLTRMSAALALIADASLMILGGSLKRRERISARLGDMLSQLYLASAVLKYYHDHQEPESDVDYVCWSLQQCLYKIQIASNDVLDNFPQRFVGKLLSWIIFPFGQAYRAPQDQLHKNIVVPMLSSSDLRDRLTKYCYVSKHEKELSYRLDKALEQVANVEPILKKLHKAVQFRAVPSQYRFTERVQSALQSGIITADEARALNEFEVLRSEIIKVNEFSFDLETVIA